jgi:pimeloyl-ACP methyl ester carboxylesterase
MSRTRRRIWIAIVAGVALLLLVVGGMGEVLSRPALRAIGEPPSDLHASSVHLVGPSSQVVSGWLARGSPGMGAVLLLHGVRSDRTQMLGRARFLRAAGYSVMLIDLPAHGESSGDRITFGAREAIGVAAALEFLRRELPGERLGVIGVSLGAASLVLSRPSPAPEAVVLESMYPTISDAVSDRLTIRLGRFGAKLAPLLLWQLPLRTGVTEEQLRPIVELPSLGAPVLVAAGTRDRHTTWAETRRIFESAAQPKELWAVDGAAHVDLYAHDPVTYKTRILRFLARYLRPA